MSIFSDYKCGALTDEQFENECRRMNRRDNIEREMIVTSLEEMCDLMCGSAEEEQEDEEDADSD